MIARVRIASGERVITRILLAASIAALLAACSSTGARREAPAPDVAVVGVTLVHPERDGADALTVAR